MRPAVNCILQLYLTCQGIFENLRVTSAYGFALLFQVRFNPEQEPSGSASPQAEGTISRALSRASSKASIKAPSSVAEVRLKNPATTKLFICQGPKGCVRSVSVIQSSEGLRLGKAPAHRHRHTHPPLLGIFQR